MQTPVLFIIFNRKDVALKAIDAIRAAKPKKMYIAGDGPRPDRPDDRAKVEATRQAVMEAIDWDCEIKTLFRDTNMGCGPGVHDAICWLFRNEECGIILEDDCVAHPTFFTFMDEMLTRYADDQRIGMVDGMNEISDKYKPESSFVFTNYKQCCGWGTWRRAWKNMDLSMNWREHNPENVICNCGRRGSDRKEWLFKLREIDLNHVSAWDWQWYFSLAAQNQLAISPSVNLITNIGNTPDATHTALTDISRAVEPLNPPYIAPRNFAPDIKFEQFFHKQSNTLRLRISRMLPHGLKQQLKRIIVKYMK